MFKLNKDSIKAIAWVVGFLVLGTAITVVTADEMNRQAYPMYHVGETIHTLVYYTIEGDPTSAVDFSGTANSALTILEVLPSGWYRVHDYFGTRDLFLPPHVRNLCPIGQDIINQNLYNYSTGTDLTLPQPTLFQIVGCGAVAQGSVIVWYGTEGYIAFMNPWAGR